GSQSPLWNELLEARIVADGVEVFVAAGLLDRPLVGLDCLSQMFEGTVGPPEASLEACRVEQRQHVVRLSGQNLLDELERLLEVAGVVGLERLLSLRRPHAVALSGTAADREHRRSRL